MLVKVTAENFKSFEETAELTMVSSAKIRKNNEHKVTIKRVNLLKSAVVYGANASGKSNLVEILRFMKYCVLKGIPLEAKQMYCRNKEENASKESVFEVQLVKHNKFYAYGFSMILSQRTITGEWAYELLPGGDAQMIFEREAGQPPQLGDKINISAADRTKFQIYADDMTDNRNSLFLSEMNRNKNISEHSKLAVFRRIFEWFSNDLVIYSPNTPITNFEYYYDADSLETVNRLVESFDTGISEVRIDKLSMEDISSKLPKEIFMDIVEEIKEKMATGKHKDVKISLRYNKDFYNFSMDDQQDLEITTLSLKHGNSVADFGFSEESDGTRRLFDLMDMLLKTDDDETVYVIDELERSLHPKLTYHFIELFKKHHEKKNDQLIFTTHEPTIMDQELFRRDEIWFVERNADNCSHLYSLDQYKERYDKKLSKAYLEGEIWRNSRIQVFFVCKGGRIMAPVRSYGNWHIRKSDQEPAVDPYCKYYFIAEGANTEKFYFEKLIDERKSLGFKDTFDIRFLEKTEEDQNISYPAHLIKFAERLKKTGEIEFDDKQDKMVVVFDADIFEKKVCNYQELLRDKSKSSIYAITNPAFELFLLLHIENSFEEIIDPNYSLILENRKVQGKTPVYNMLLEKKGMNAKHNPDIGNLALKIDVAIEQEKKINQDISDCKGKLTSNIAQIISGIKRA